MEAVHIIGAGGIGCAVGYSLRAAGVEVTFVETNPRKIEAGKRDGIKIDDRPALPAEFVHCDDWVPAPDPTIILCVKCYDNATVLDKLPANVNVIPIQNGFDPQLDSRHHQWEGIASFVSECEPDRPHTRITRYGRLHIGQRSFSRDAKSAERSAPLQELRVAANLFPIVMVPNIAPIKYAKLMYNAAISPLAAAAGIDNGQLLSIPAARRFFFALLQENYRILKAAGIELGKIGPFHPRTVAWILRRKWLAGLMAKAFEPSLRRTYCSMAGEIPKGRTEIDNYNGHLIRLAKLHGANGELNQSVYDLVRRMTVERIAPNLNMLDQLK